MSHHLIRTMVDELVGEHAPHLGASIASEIGSRMRSSTPPRALVLRLEPVRASSGGLRRQVTVLGPAEVYV